MKNKLIAITLSIACVLASCLPSALANFNHVENTSVELEEVSDQPTWNVIKKNDDIQQLYQETYDRVYQETLNNLAQQQAETQANVENTMNQLKNSDIMKWFQANNEKVVKDIDYDKNGNLVVKYSNGTQKFLTNKVASVPQVADYEQVGYVVPCSITHNNGYHYDNGVVSFDYNCEKYIVKLVSVEEPNKYNPLYDFTYSIYAEVNVENYSSTSPETTKRIMFVGESGMHQIIINGNGTFQLNSGCHGDNPFTPPIGVIVYAD